MPEKEQEQKILVYSGSEMLKEYVEFFGKKLRLIGITEASSHSIVLPDRKNALYLYSKFCDTCYINLPELSEGTYSIPDDTRIKGVQSMVHRFCPKHIRGYMLIRDLSGCIIAYYSEEKNIIFIRHDITHIFNSVGRKFIGFVLDRITSMLNLGKLGFDAVLESNINAINEIRELDKSHIRGLSAIRKAYNNSRNEIVKRISCIREDAIAGEELRLKARYEALLSSKIGEKEEEIQILKDKYSNAFVLGSLCDGMTSLGYTLAVIDGYPYYLKKARILFTHSSSFGAIVRKIEPPEEMKAYIGVCMKGDMTQILHFNAFNEISPVKYIRGIHFMGSYICLGDRENLLQTKIDASSLDNAVNELVVLLENASFDHGIDIPSSHASCFPPRLLEIYSEWKKYVGDSRGVQR